MYQLFKNFINFLMIESTDSYDLNAAVIAAHNQQQLAENFGSTIKRFIKSLENNQFSVLSLNSMCNQWNFQRRRFYDVINVLESINYCKKIAVDEVCWNGKKGFINYLKDIKNKTTENTKYVKCISISDLTTKFIESFFKNNKQIQNIKDLGIFLSKENGRIKTTTCKLYQISFILEACGIISKDNIPGSVKLKNEYFQNQILYDFSIESLLNYPPSIKSYNTQRLIS